MSNQTIIWIGYVLIVIVAILIIRQQREQLREAETSAHNFGLGYQLQKQEVIQLSRQVQLLEAKLLGMVDPWARQRTLMELSGQELPEDPRLTPNVLLYAALILEEVGETMGALAQLMLDHIDEDEEKHPPETEPVRCYVSNLLQVSAELAAYSHRMRGEIKEFPKGWVIADLLGQDAKLGTGHLVGIFDGTCDIAVVNCGFALAMGLPGAKGYAETVGSNLSKADPSDGLIHKDPSGKWIKGPNYFAPDLRRVLIDQRIANAKGAVEIPRANG